MTPDELKIKEVQIALDGCWVRMCMFPTCCEPFSNKIFQYVMDSDFYTGFYVRPCKFHLNDFRKSGNYREVK